MYKLTVIAGPNRGTSYVLNEGETSVGRQTGNVIVLPSAKVSKKHCAFILFNGSLSVADRGSSNGTFVNGALAKAKPLKLGDRVSVGDVVMEVTKPVVRQSADAPAAPLPGGNFDMQALAAMPTPMGMPGAGMPADAEGAPQAGPLDLQAPTDLKGRIAWAFERTVMPFFYGLNLKQEWKSLCVIFFSGFVVAAMVISMYPLVISNQETVVRQASLRAQALARQLVERNGAAVAAQAESKAEIGGMSREDGVVVAVLTDMESRIIAPAVNANNHLSAGEIGVVARRAAKRFGNGLETGVVVKADSETVVAVEPLKVLNPRMGRNVAVAMAVVAIDISLDTPDVGTIALTYSHSFIVTALIGAFLILVMYRLTLKRFEVLNEDLDKVLKGELNAVTNEFKAEEFDQLWDVIGSALQRIPKGSEGDMGNQARDPVEEYIQTARMVGDVSPFGVLVCDGERKVLYTNPMFEEVSGIRASDASGQEISGVARDQAFSSLIIDMFTQAKSSGRASEDFEFSGVAFKVHVSTFGGQNPTGYMLAAVKVEG